MARNIEIKARDPHPLETREKAEKLATQGPITLNQIDTFFSVSRGRLKWRQIDNYHELIFYERPDLEGPKLSTYVVKDVTDHPDLFKMLEQSLGVLGVVRKQRTLFKINQTRIHLDQVEGLGSFLELETVLDPEQTTEEGHQIIENIMANLSLRPEFFEPQAYLDLILTTNDQS